MKLVICLMSLFLGVAQAQVEKKATYSAATAPFAPAATATDVCKIVGHASKTIKVVQVDVGTIQTTAGVNLWRLIKRSTANVGGTPVILDYVKYNSDQGTNGASAVRYSANPSSLGTAEGLIEAFYVASPAAATAGIGDAKAVIKFGENEYAQPVILQGTDEALVLNFNGTAIPSGMVVACKFTWFEE